MAPDYPHYLKQPAVSPALWPLDSKITFLNHGSFGSCPWSVLEFQRELRNRMERHPVQFLARDLESLMDDARGELAQFINCPAADLVFVTNATSGVNAVLRALKFAPGDELLVTDHEYNACRNALEFIAERSGARVVVCSIPFPLQSSDQIVQALLESVTSRTRLALVDHVTSQTGLILPIPQIAQALAEKGVDLLVDGAHAPGMVPLDISRLGVAYYVGNCHKWICAPKSVGFLYVEPSRQAGIHPLSISHGANSTRTDRSHFLIEFGWTGTFDPTPALSVPAALRFMQSVLPGGWVEVQSRNRELALAARRVICDSLDVPMPSPDGMIGSMASIPLPDGVAGSQPSGPLYLDPLQDRLRLEHGIEAPIVPWPKSPKRLVRVSAQLYNSLPQYQFLGESLRTELPGEYRTTW